MSCCFLVRFSVFRIRILSNKIDLQSLQNRILYSRLAPHPKSQLDLPTAKQMELVSTLEVLVLSEEWREVKILCFKNWKMPRSEDIMLQKLEDASRNMDFFMDLFIWLWGEWPKYCFWSIGGRFSYDYIRYWFSCKYYLN